MQKHVVYMHTNIYNGKCYIGTAKDPKIRWAYNGIYYKGSPRFYNAIKKYGWSAFVSQVLFEDLTPDEMNEWEEFCVKFFHSDNPKFGYNLEGGGKRQKKIAQETRNKISANNYGRTEESREATRQRSLGKSPTSETRDKIKNHPNSVEQARSQEKRIIQMGLCGNPIAEYNSMTEAAKSLGKSYRNISGVCRNKRKSAYGFKWKYA